MPAPTRPDRSSPSQDSLTRTAADLALGGLGGLMLLLLVPVMTETGGLDVQKMLLLLGFVLPPVLAMILVQRRRGPGRLDPALTRVDRRER